MKFYLTILISILSITAFSQKSVPDSASHHKSIISSDSLYKVASKYVGTKYRPGGKSPDGFDCSGFVSFILSKFNYSISGSSSSMSAFGKLVDLKSIAVGDLVFFKGHNPASASIGHVALVLDAGADFISIVHSTCHKGVIIENLKTSEYFLKRYVFSKRIF